MNQITLDEQSALLSRAQAVLPDGGINRSNLPTALKIIPERGEGARVIDANGRSFVDYHSAAGALILGHSHPAVVRSIQEQAGRGLAFFGSTSKAALTLAEELTRAIPCAEKVIFTTTGSESTAYALRIARAVTRRNLFLKFDGAYHGNHDTTQAKSGPGTNQPFGRPENAGVPEDIARLALVAPYNDLESVKSIFAQHGSDIAAVILEPVQKHIYPIPDFLEGLRQLTKAHGTLLIFDEVVTGFRLAYGGAQEFFGVTPDLSCHGKIIGGGLPLGAVAGPAAMLDLCSGLRQNEPAYVLVNGTLHGAPLAAAAGNATLEQVRKPGFYKTLHAWSDSLRQELQKTLARHSIGAKIVGGASMWQVSFLQKDALCNADLINEDKKRLAQLDYELVRNGVYALSGNRRFVTSAHGSSEMEITVRAFDAACRKVAQM